MKSAKSHQTRIAARTVLALTAALLAVTAPPASAQKRGGGEPPRQRMLLVFAPDENNKALQEQYAQLQRASGEIDSQDVDVIYVIGDHSVKLPPPDMKTVSGDDMRKHYHVDADGFRIVLVGTDGWEKKRWNEPTDPHQIMSKVSDMPKPKSALDDEKK